LIIGEKNSTMHGRKMCCMNPILTTLELNNGEKNSTIRGQEKEEK